MNTGSNGQLGITPPAPFFVFGKTKHEGANPSSSLTRARSLPFLHNPTTPAAGDDAGRPLPESLNPSRPLAARKSTSLPNLQSSQVLRQVIAPYSPSKSVSYTPLDHDGHAYDRNPNPSTRSLPSSIPANLIDAENSDLNSTPERRDVLPRSSLEEEFSELPPEHNTIEVISSLLKVSSDSDLKDTSTSASPKASKPFISPDLRPRTFKRFRSSLGRSIRVATRTKIKGPKWSISTDANGLNANAAAVPMIRKKRSDIVEEEPEEDKTKKFPKVPFRLGTRGDLSTAGKSHIPENSERLPPREPGYTSYATPSLRLASLSPPVPHLLLQPSSDNSRTRQLVSSGVNPLASRQPVRPRPPLSQSRSGSGPNVQILRRTSKDTTRKSNNAPLTQVPDFINWRGSMEFELPPSPTRRSGTLQMASTSHSPLSSSRPVQQPLLVGRHVAVPSSSRRPPFPTPPAPSDHTVNPQHRDLLRRATSILCKQLLKLPEQSAAGFGSIELEEIEVRLRALARLERIWGKSDSPDASRNTPASSNLSSYSGETRERRVFSETLRDGYVLCQ